MGNLVVGIVTPGTGTSGTSTVAPPTTCNGVADSGPVCALGRHLCSVAALGMSGAGCKRGPRPPFHRAVTRFRATVSAKRLAEEDDAGLGHDPTAKRPRHADEDADGMPADDGGIAV